MRSLVALILLLLCSPAVAQTPTALTFGPAAEVHYIIGSPRQTQGPVFANSYTAAGPVAGAWRTVDLTQWGVPADADWAFLQGFLIITHGSTAETADLQVTFRATGDASITCAYTSPWYAGQTVEAAIGGGQRSTLGLWVPLTNGMLDWCWTRSTGGQWPTNSAYGVNLSIQAWAR